MIKKYMSRKIDIDDKLVNDFKRIMNEEISDRLIRIYIKANNRQKATEDYVKTLSDIELKNIIEKGLLSELKMSGEY